MIHVGCAVGLSPIGIFFDNAGFLDMGGASLDDNALITPLWPFVQSVDGASIRLDKVVHDRIF